jgi:hypothetical protein
MFLQPYNHFEKYKNFPNVCFQSGEAAQAEDFSGCCGDHPEAGRGARRAQRLHNRREKPPLS